MATRHGRRAADIIAELEHDPAYLARVAAIEAERKPRLDAIRMRHEAILWELAQKGCHIDSLENVTQATEAPDVLLGVLLGHLRTESSSDVRQLIAATLNQFDVRPRWSELVDLFRAEPDGNAKDMLAGALAVWVDESTIGELIELAKTTSRVESRGMLLSVFAPVRFRPIAKRRRLLALVREQVESFARDPEIGPTIRDAIERVDRYEAKLAARR